MDTDPATIADIDEALAHLSAGLYAAQVTGNECRAQVVQEYIDRMLDKRLALANG